MHYAIQKQEEKQNQLLLWKNLVYLAGKAELSFAVHYIWKGKMKMNTSCDNDIVAD